MENKHVGFLMLGISIALVVIIFLFRNALRVIVSASCTGEHGNSCPMYTTINQQTYLALAIVTILAIVGLVLIFTKPKERVVIKKVKEKKQKKLNLEKLSSEERKVIKILQKENGAIFQKTIAEELGVGKVKITRLMDKLEAKQLIERKRRGMNNIIVLKNS